MKTLLGQRIREQRREKGWTMDKLAEKADLSVNYVGDLERGRRQAWTLSSGSLKHWMFPQMC